ncbi:MAG: restriction endonuclease [Oscillochloris sp.]|nr:restriction endonuclease [Oscillochloris sp.]
MSVDTSPEQRGNQKKPTSDSPRPSWVQRTLAAVAAVKWGDVLLVALLMAVAWCGLFMATPMLQILAGIVPVLAGLYLGKRVKGNYLANGIMLGLSGFLFGLIIVVIYGMLIQSGAPVPQPQLGTQSNQTTVITGVGDLVAIYFLYSLFALLPFPAFGTVMAGRTDERNRELSKEVDERGGRLERPGVIRTLEDLRGLSLPQFGSYVSNLYKKKGFTFGDYRFIDKDKHLDLEMDYNGEHYLMRLSVADKVRAGTVESLIQDMRRRNIPKGLVLTSTEFMPDTIKAASGRKNLIIIDGQTLFEIAES